MLLVILMDYFLLQRKAAIPFLAYLALCFVFEELIVFWPMMLYLCLHQPGWPWYLAGLFMPLIARFASLDLVFLLMALMALLLFFKDRAASQLLTRYYEAADTSAQEHLQAKLQLRTLRREQDAQVQLAVVQERNRIARDIHDHVGHVLSRGILQARALGLMIKDEKLQSDMAMLQDSLNSAMNAIRASVHNTSQDYVALDAEIKALLSDFTFCPVHYRNSSAGEWPLKQKYAVIALIKEALSNIMNHSNATMASITLSELRNSRLVLINDNGTKQPTSNDSGLGLSAMEERVRGLGGSLSVTRENGFRLLITLPKEDA